MKNIFKIFISDVKRIFQNVVAVVVIMGLCVIPCLYAWFNIFSNWDPYGESSTSNLKVAVVSEDEGVTVAGISVNIGSSVVEALQENKVMDGYLLRHPTRRWMVYTAVNIMRLL